MLPLKKLEIDDEASGMDFMGLVDVPAHGKMWHIFGKQRTPAENKVEFAQTQKFNEEKRIVTGVAIATDLPIYRRDPNGYEYNVIFTKDTTYKIAQKLAENGFMNNVNEQHDSERSVQDLYLFESYFVNKEKSNIPEQFKDYNLQEGSWIVSYKVNNDKVWQSMKRGEYVGFSIEGWFNEVDVNVKKSEMKLKERFKRLFEKKKMEAEEQVFGEAVAQDGTMLAWEGEFPQEGGALYMIDEESGELISYPEGETSAVIDGVLKAMTVDASGVITSIVETEEQKSDDEEKKEEEMEKTLDEFSKKQSKNLDSEFKKFREELIEEVNKNNVKMFEDYKKKVDELKEQNTELQEKLNAFQDQKSSTIVNTKNKSNKYTKFK